MCVDRGFVSLKSVSTNRHAVIGSVDDVSVLQFAHRFELLQDAIELDVDVFGARELSSQFIANRRFIAPFPHAGDFHFVAQSWMTVMKGMGRQIIEGQSRLQRVERRWSALIFVIDCAILRKQFWFAIARVVGMRESKVDEERVSVVARLPLAQVIQNLLRMPSTARFIGAATFGIVPRTVNKRLAAS